jgi:tetratricopeptide (TPR) repeat protein
MEHLLERGGELEQLAARIGRVASGEGGSVIVEGPAGIGKSRLLAEALGRAGRELRVLSARGTQLEREFSFGVVRQLIAPELGDRREALLAGAAAPAAAVFGDLQADDGASFGALHALYWLVLNLAEDRPVLLAVDDLQWCDRPSLLFLAYLARRLEGQPILLLAGVRSAEPGTDAALLAEIARDPAATSIRLRPLSPEAVAAFVEERLGAADETFAATCLETTGGNPLLLTQLVTALRGVRPAAEHAPMVRDIGSHAVSQTVLLRLARLPAEATPVAQAVAVLGDGAGLHAVAELAGLDERRAAEATRALTHAEILSPAPALTFVHPLIRDAVYRELPERARRHARAATILRDRGAPTEHIAAQLLNVPPRGEGWAASLLVEAGRDAMHAGAADSAATYLRRALEEPPPAADRAQVLLELGVAESLTNGPAAAEHLARAYETLADPAARTAAAALLGRALMFMGTADDAAAIAARAAADAPDEDLRMQLEAFGFMTTIFGAGDPGRLAELRAYREPPGDGPGARMLAALAAWEWACSDGTAAEAARLALAALSGDVLLRADNALICFAAIITLVIGDRPEAAAVWERSLAEAHRRGSLFSMSSNHLWYGFSLLRRGELADAEDALRAAHDEYTLWGMGPHATSLAATFLADVLLERGRPADAARLLEELAPVNPGGNSWGWWLSTRAAVLTAQGDTRAAIAVADELGRLCEQIIDPARYWWRSLKAQALGPTEEAIALARDELVLTRRFGAPSLLGRTLRVLGTLEDDPDTLREAVAVLEGSTARLELAKALAALGELQRALELALMCGADGLVQQLHAAGARPRDAAAPTERERRIADLAAAGRTDREIAQELYVTPQTVVNARRKLGIA